MYVSRAANSTLTLAVCVPGRWQTPYITYTILMAYLAPLCVAGALYLRLLVIVRRALFFTVRGMKASDLGAILMDYDGTLLGSASPLNAHRGEGEQSPQLESAEHRLHCDKASKNNPMQKLQDDLPQTVTLQHLVTLVRTVQSFEEMVTVM